MSSIVNKSGTRFAPKIRQRRVAVNVEKRKPESLVNNEDESAGLKPTDRPVGPRSDSVSLDSADPFSQGSLKSLLVREDESGDPNMHDITSMSQLAKQRRRSSRLDSLGSGNAVFKPDFLETQVAGTSVPEQSRNRRLSSISAASWKKRRVSSISETDSSFQAIKKRRMSSRSAISKKSGSGQRISIVPRMGSDEVSTASGAADSSNGANDNLFQRTDSLYEKYTISNVKEIPRHISDGDSYRYLIDEDNFTMGDLCKPNLPIGEISDNFQRAKEAAKARQAKRKQRRELRAKARQQFKPLKELSQKEDELRQENRKKAAEAVMNAEIPEADTKLQGIQLKMNPDGTFIVDEESTVVDRHQNATLQNAHKERMDENPFENLFNSATYGRQQYTDPWSMDEMVKFYKALSMWGTDFNLISQMFPYRTRRQIKAKFINEERKHPVMVELALRSKLPPDFDQYCMDVRKDLSTLEEFNAKLLQLQLEHEENLKQIEVSKQSAKEEDLQMQKAKEADLGGKKSSGGLRQDQLTAYRKTEVVLGTIDDLRKNRVKDAEVGSNN
ncbi:LAMI_0E04016g1_1 [Lachancea mirantina]|uniref:LAMI_0E04016g1_1 n=1 Tax=Lachancea mirantina TaxID=1230905 RepID=A0A1G4JK83_9SACH|nr:LAMI_0E04016g1_1 [Lachancea mirantina]